MKVQIGHNNFDKNLIPEGMASFTSHLHSQKNREKKFGIANLKLLNKETSRINQFEYHKI